MASLNLPAKFVSRERELSIIGKKLQEALQGSGTALFISGEAGVGKTRLVERALEHARTLGFQTLRGQCLLESLGPFQPIASALTDSGLGHLLAQERPPRLESVYAIARSGIILARCERERTSDPDIFLSMVIAIENFVKDSLKKMQDGEVATQVNAMRYGDFNIVNVPGARMNLVAIISGKESELLIRDIQEMIMALEAKFNVKLEEWANQGVEVPELVNFVSPLITSGKYDGTFVQDESALIRQANIFENVLQGLVRRSTQSPIALFLDDMQWADPSTLALVHFLARNIRKHRMIILCTYRPEDTAERYDGGMHQLVSTMQKMNREGLIDKLEIGRFAIEESAQLIGAVLGEDMERAFVKRLHNETEGNALFIIETLKNLYSESALVYENGRWLYDLENIRLPQRLHEAISQRLIALSFEEQSIMQAASIIGDEFTSTMLYKLTGKSRIALLKALSAIERTHHLIISSKDRYKFEHSWIRDAFYSSIPDEAKRNYHMTIGAELESEFAKGRIDALPDIVSHYLRASNGDKVLEYGLRAARHSKAHYANEEAIRFLRGMLKVIEVRNLQSDNELKLQALEELAGLLSIEGSYDEALAHVDKMLASLTNDRPLDIAKCHRLAAEILVKKDDAKAAIDSIAKGLAAISDLPPALEHARLWFVRGLAHERKGEASIAAVYFERALPEFERSSEEDLARTLTRLGSVYAQKGDYEKAVRAHERALAICEKMAWTVGSASGLEELGELYFDGGELNKALDCEKKALSLYEKIGDAEGIISSSATLGEILVEMRDFAGALDIQKRALALCDKTGDQAGGGTLNFGAGRALVGLGDHSRALQFFDEAHRLGKALKNRKLMCKGLLGSSEVYLATDDAKCAKALSDALDLALQSRDHALEGLVYRMKGLLAAKKGDREAAERSFKRALACLTKKNAAYYATLAEYGKFADDKKMIEEARRYYSGLGL